MRRWRSTVGALTLIASSGLFLSPAALAHSLKHPHLLNGDHQHPKTGAAITMSSSFDEALSVAAFTDVIVTLTPAYANGTLTATAVASGNIDLLDGTTSFTHDMSQGPAIWRIGVRPNNEDRHYIDITAEVSGLDGTDKEFRVFSIAIDAGDASQTKLERPMSNVIEGQGGQMLAIMDAEESSGPKE